MVFKLLKKDFAFLLGKKLNIIMEVFVVIALLLYRDFFMLFFVILSPILCFGLDRDIAFNSVLPVTKKQILLSKLLFMVIVQLSIVILTCISAILSNYFPYGIKLDFNGAIYELRLILLMFTVLNLATCIALKKCEKIFVATVVAITSCIAFFLLLLGIQYALEQLGVMQEGVFNSDLANNIFTAIIAVLYPLLTALGYKLAANTYANSDLFERNEI